MIEFHWEKSKQFFQTSKLTRAQDATAANQTSWCGGGWYGLGCAWKTMVDFLWQPSKQFFQILTVKYQDAATVKSETRFQAGVLQAGSRAWRWLKRTWRWLEDNDWQPLTGSPRALLPTPLPPETMHWCTVHNTLRTVHWCTINWAQCTDALCTIHATPLCDQKRCTVLTRICTPRTFIFAQWRTTLPLKAIQRQCRACCQSTELRRKSRVHTF